MKSKIKLSTAYINLQIISAQVWAIVITACSYVLKGTTGSSTVMYMLIAGAVPHFFSFNSNTARKKATGETRYCE